MRRRITTKQLIPVVFTLAISTVVFGQNNKTISDGQKLKVEGKQVFYQTFQVNFLVGLGTLKAAENEGSK